MGVIGLDRNLEALYLRFSGNKLWDGDLHEEKSQGSYLVTLGSASLRQENEGLVSVKSGTVMHPRERP